MGPAVKQREQLDWWPAPRAAKKPGKWKDSYAKCHGGAAKAKLRSGWAKKMHECYEQQRNEVLKHTKTTLKKRSGRNTATGLAFASWRPRQSRAGVGPASMSKSARRLARDCLGVHETKLPD
eukprot:562546-Pyramimonas_sp.AAC.1